MNTIGNIWTNAVLEQWGQSGEQVSIVCCLKCANQIVLDTVYDNFEGKVRCKDCYALHEIKMDGGELTRLELALPFEKVLPEAVPTGVQEDVSEAFLCLENGAFRGCVVMCRRALEQVTDFEKANGRWLAEKIEDLHKRGLIGKLVYSMASAIKEFGNYGAHPNSDLLQQVDKDIAEEILRITLKFLNEIYKGRR